MHIQEWLETVPAISVYLLVGIVIGVESLGIPLPGEVVLISAALLAAGTTASTRGSWVAARRPGR